MSNNCTLGLCIFNVADKWFVVEKISQFSSLVHIDGFIYIYIEQMLS